MDGAAGGGRKQVGEGRKEDRNRHKIAAIFSDLGGRGREEG